jgi:hypothetical protein
MLAQMRDLAGPTKRVPGPTPRSSEPSTGPQSRWAQAIG